MFKLLGRWGLATTTTLSLVARLSWGTASTVLIVSSIAAPKSLALALTLSLWLPLATLGLALRLVRTAITGAALSAGALVSSLLLGLLLLLVFGYPLVGLEVGDWSRDILRCVIDIEVLVNGLRDGQDFGTEVALDII